MKRCIPMTCPDIRRLISSQRQGFSCPPPSRQYWSPVPRPGGWPDVVFSSQNNEASWAVDAGLAARHRPGYISELSRPERNASTT